MFIKASLLLLSATVSANLIAAPTAYLPMGLDSHLESQIDRLFAMTRGTPLSKPYAINEIALALREVKSKDRHLYKSIKSQIQRYYGQDKISRVGIKTTANTGEDVAIRNQRGLDSGEYAQGFFEGVWRPGSNSLLQVGLDYRVDGGNLVPYNTYFAYAFGNMQFDIGYREHWFSPFKHSAQVISNNAKMTPSISFSTAVPIKDWWNLDIDLFYSKLDEVEEGIRYQDEWHDGKPSLIGTHLSIEPIDGWKLGFNRIMQFGGGPREVSFGDIMRAFFDPAANDNTSDDLSTDEEFGDQIASVTTSINFDWGMPVEFYAELAGEDTQGESNFSLGNQANNFGLYLPQIGTKYSARYEYNRWKTRWYTNHNYKYGNTNNGNVFGHYGADQRVFGDGTPAQVHNLSFNYYENYLSSWQLGLSSIENDDSEHDYSRGYEVTLSNSRKWQEYRVESSISYGKDVFAQSYGYASVAFFW